MITLLAKIFIKENMDETRIRGAYGTLCGAAGIFLNIVLFSLKFFAGLISGSIAVTADAFNNLSDAGSSIVTLLGFKIAGQEPDAEHPYGHGRMEYIAGFVVSALILAMAFSLIKDSALKILNPEPTEFSWLVVGILAVSIAVKLYMAFYNTRVGRRIDSAAVRATATDSISDSVATGVALLSTLLAHYTGLQIDGVCGLLVGAMIGLAGLGAAKDTLDPLLGKPPEKEFVDEIEDITLNFDSRIIGMHDLLVHDYGPGRRFISLHAEVPAEEGFLELHDVIDNLEHELRKRLGCMATVHMDPVVTSDSRVAELKQAVTDCVGRVNPGLRIHDFRVVFGDTHTNLIFDVLAPMDHALTDDIIRRDVQDRVWESIGRDYRTVIDVDRDYT